MHNRLQKTKVSKSSLPQLIVQEQTFWIPCLPLVSDYFIYFVLGHLNLGVCHGSKFERSVKTGSQSNGDCGVQRQESQKDSQLAEQEGREARTGTSNLLLNVS